MRKKIAIQLNDKTVTTTEHDGLDVVHAGRYQIAGTLLANGIAKVDPIARILGFPVDPAVTVETGRAGRA